MPVELIEAGLELGPVYSLVVDLVVGGGDEGLEVVCCG